MPKNNIYFNDLAIGTNIEESQILYKWNNTKRNGFESIPEEVIQYLAENAKKEVKFADMKEGKDYVIISEDWVSPGTFSIMSYFENYSKKEPYGLKCCWDHRVDRWDKTFNPYYTNLDRFDSDSPGGITNYRIFEISDKLKSFVEKLMD
jgi:hypothetical protein